MSTHTPLRKRLRIPTLKNTDRSRLALVAALAILHALAFLAVLLADVKGMWVDEKIAYRLVTTYTPTELIFDGRTWPPHYPTWFVLTDIIGMEASLWLNRLSYPALVYPTYKIGQRYANAEAGLQAAFFVSLSPFLAAQASWLRMYGVLNASLVWTLWYGVSNQHARASLTAILAGLLHPFGVFGGLWLATHTRHHWTRKQLVAASLAFAPIGIAISYVISQQGLSITHTGVVHAIKPDLLRLTLTPATSLAGSPHTKIQVALLLTGTAALAVGTHHRALLTWILFPIIGLTAASYLITPLYRIKYFGFTAPAVAILLTGSRRPQWLRIIAGACFGAAMMFSWYQRVEIPAIVARRFIFWF